MVKRTALGVDIGQAQLVIAGTNGAAVRFDRESDHETCMVWLRSKQGEGELAVVAEASSMLCELIASPAFAPLREVIRVVHPNRVASVRRGFGWSKSDSNDARALAHLAEQGVGRRAEAPETLRFRQLVRFRVRAIRWRRELRGLVSAGTTHPELRDELSLLLDHVEASIRAATGLSHIVARQFGPDFDIISSIEGIGPTTAARLLAEIGDISRFQSARKLVGLCGLHPFSRATGKRSSPGLGASIGRRGNRHLRAAFLSAVSGVRLHHPVLSEFDASLRARGKAPMVVRVAVARKIAALVFKTLMEHRSAKPTRTEPADPDRDP